MSLNNLLSDLNERQKAAATASSENTLVLAGAGTGKTKTIIARAAFLITEGVPAEQIQVLTFTRRSSAEIVERVRQSIGERSEGLEASTFHRWCMSLMRSAPYLFGYDNYTIMDREDQVQLFKLIRGSAPQRSIPRAAQLCDLYSYAKNTKINLTNAILRQLPEYEDKKNDIARTLKAYELKKRSAKYLDYDDILAVVAYRLANSEKALEFVEFSHEHILIDEMQDTNPLQWDVLSPLVGKVNLFCVGDDAQSIYGFRGADFKNVHNFNDRVPNSETLKLEDNYRSTQEILDLSNWLLDKSPIDYKKRLISVKGAGMKPQLHDFMNKYAEATWIAEDLLRRHKEGMEWREHMVLVRSAFQARSVEAAFLNRKIPYRFIGGTALMQSAHVRDVISALRIVSNVTDELAWMRFLTLWPKIGEKTATDIISYLFDRNITDIAQTIRLLRSLIQNTEIVSTLQNVSNQATDVPSAIRVAYEGLHDCLANEYKNDWDKRKIDFKLIQTIAEKHVNIRDFIEEYTLDPIYESQINRTSSDDAVTIITIHSAKGAESDTCYLVDVGPGSYPNQWFANALDDVEEERRVLYVAITRARKELILTRSFLNLRAQKNKTIGDNDPVESYFFNDLPVELVEHYVHYPHSIISGGDRESAPLEEADLSINYN